MTLDKVAPQDRDKLCQISQQGMAQAAETLSRLLRQPVSVEVADAWMSDQVLPAKMIAGPSIGVYMGVSGDINGGLLLVLSEPCGEWLSQQLLGVADIEDLLTEPVSSTLKEVGNIMASSFLASLDDQLGLRTLPAPPVLSRQTLAALLERWQPNRNETCLVVRTRLRGVGAATENLRAAIYLFPETASLKTLLARIGLSEE